jgi:hypothetical protein
MLKLLFFLLFALSLIQKFIGTAWTEAQLGKSEVFRVAYVYIKPNLDLFFVLGLAWLIQKYLRQFVFGDYSK